MRIVDFYNVLPRDVSPGDAMVATLVLRVGHDGTYRVYRCRWLREFLGEDGTPQGERMIRENAQKAMESVFPVVGWAGLQPSED